MIYGSHSTVNQWENFHRVYTNAVKSKRHETKRENMVKMILHVRGVNENGCQKIKHLWNKITTYLRHKRVLSILKTNRIYCNVEEVLKLSGMRGHTLRTEIQTMNLYLPSREIFGFLTYEIVGFSSRK